MLTAVKAFSATFNGREYSAEKGQQVDAPKALAEALKAEGIVREKRAAKPATEKEKQDD